MGCAKQTVLRQATNSAHLVAQWIADHYSKRVVRSIYAHSQAAIASPQGVPDTGISWLGDVNSYYALIPDQLKCFPEQARADVSLMLIDGCINDVNAFEIVSLSLGMSVASHPRTKTA